MADINCPYRSRHGDQPVCQIVADLTDLPLSLCHVNDSACAYCLKCEIAPQVPNKVTASMSIHAATLAGETKGGSIARRMQVHLGEPTPAVTTCVLRGPEIRKVSCKPCQADSLVPVMMPVYRCPRKSECTLHNTGTFPKIQACSTCEERLENAVQLDVKMPPQAVLEAIQNRNRI